MEGPGFRGKTHCFGKRFAIFMTIRIVVTGGTLDKEYDELTGELVFRRTHLPDMLKSARSRLDTKITKVMLADSAGMSDEERKAILRHCRNCKEERIVILHGTDSMAGTANLLAKSVNHKTVVLTGAMVPYTCSKSDALFNLGSALAFAQTLPPGVYISMHGRYFNWDNVRKNSQTGEFEEIGA